MQKPTIIAATDLSRRAEGAVKRAALVCKNVQGSLTLVHAINLRFLERLLVGDRRNRLKADIAKKLEGELEGLGTPGEVLVEIGFPSEVIMDTARLKNPQLIVLGDHGEFHLKDVLLGTTAKHVIEHAHIPLLVVKNDDEAPYKKIFLSTDFSDSSRRAIELAATFFPDATFVLYHAYLVPGEIISARYGFDSAEVDKMLEELRQEATEKIERFKATFSACNVSMQTMVRASASPTESILEDSQAQKADLLVMGTKGMSTFMPLMVGSNTDSLLRHSTIDMLIYKA